MAKSRRENDFEEFSSRIDELQKENEKLQKIVSELEAENKTYKNDNEVLLQDIEELKDRVNETKMEIRMYKKEINRMIETEYMKDKDRAEYIEELSNKMATLKIKNIELKNEGEELKTEVEKLKEKNKNMMKDVCPKPSNVGKIPTYTIIRKYEYPYFLNYDKALEELKKEYPSLEEVYKVNYDHEETYSSSILQNEFEYLDIRNNEILLKNYTEKKFLEDLKNISTSHTNGCHTFSVIKKDFYTYYAFRVQNENYAQTKMKLGGRFPDSVEIYNLFSVPNAVTLHNRIKENLSETHVNGNHIKLSSNYTEEEFIRDVKELAEPRLDP